MSLLTITRATIEIECICGTKRKIEGIVKNTPFSCYGCNAMFFVSLNGNALKTLYRNNEDVERAKAGIQEKISTAKKTTAKKKKKKKKKKKAAKK